MGVDRPPWCLVPAVQTTQRHSSLLEMEHHPVSQQPTLRTAEPFRHDREIRRQTRADFPDQSWRWRRRPRHPFNKGLKHLTPCSHTRHPRFNPAIPLASQKCHNTSSRPLDTLVAMRVAFAFGLCLIAGVLTTTTMTEGRLVALPRQAIGVTAAGSAPARVALGRLLFWDPVLSGNRDVACATCHHPDFAYSDGRDLSLGTNAVGLGPARRSAGAQPIVPVRRNSPTLVNVAFNGLTLDKPGDGASAPMFWDMRVRSLEAQALEPIKAHDEMRATPIPSVMPSAPSLRGWRQPRSTAVCLRRPSTIATR